MGIFDFLKPNLGTSNLRDCDKLLKIANEGIMQLETNFKRLSDSGKFEVLLFNSINVLTIYYIKYPNIYADTDKKLTELLINQAKTYQVTLNPEQLKKFIDSRYMFYGKEMENILSGEYYLPGKVYSAFYISPFKSIPEQNFDLGEVMPFLIALMEMYKWISNKAEKI